MSEAERIVAAITAPETRNNHAVRGVLDLVNGEPLSESEAVELYRLRLMNRRYVGERIERFLTPLGVEVANLLQKAAAAQGSDQ